MSLSVNQMILGLRKATGTDITDMPDADATLYLNRTWWELMDKFDFREKEQTYNFNTVAGTKSYNVPALFEAIQLLSIEDPNTKLHTQLERMEVSDFENTFVNTSDARGKPIKYYRENNTVNLYFIPDAVYPIIMKYLTTLADLATGNTPGIPQSWHEIIQFGGIWRAFLDLGITSKANEFYAYYSAGINTLVPVKSKEEVDSRFSGLQMLKRRPSDDETITGRRIN